MVTITRTSGGIRARRSSNNSNMVDRIIMVPSIRVRSTTTHNNMARPEANKAVEDPHNSTLEEDPRTAEEVRNKDLLPGEISA